MKTKDFVIVAGLQTEIVSRLSEKFEERDGKLVPLRGLQCPAGYTDEYVARLYGRVAKTLKTFVPLDREMLFRDVTLTLLYVDRPERGVHALLDGFGVEALVAPLRLPQVERMRTPNEVGHVVNMSMKAIRTAMRRVRALRSAIVEEVTNRDNKTCLLLPPKTFGRGFDLVKEQVIIAARDGEQSDDLRRRIRHVSRSLPTSEGKYFIGDRKLVFRCPPKARARHGLAPIWGEGEHESPCVIRGRLRFGTSFDARFHYDCNVDGRRIKTLPGCHESRPVSRRWRHANIAPNDHVRKK